ncbi:MAG: acyl-CoA thioesterase [Desulfuromonadaceae bacterium]|nr:acyl-CoA thioesterase [Geobacteraceae bacterium]
MHESDFYIDYRVHISDINYGGHVANSAVLNFFQDARIAYLKHLGDFSEMDIGGCGLIQPEAHVKYKAEMFHNDTLKIRVRVSEIKRSSFELCYSIERDGEITAEGSTPLVCFDYERKKPCRLPPGFRTALEGALQMATSKKG